MKPFIGLLKSKTFWLNVAGAAALIINGMHGVIPEQTAAVILAGLNVLNRFLTNKPLAEK